MSHLYVRREKLQCEQFNRILNFYFVCSSPSSFIFFIFHTFNELDFSHESLKLKFHERGYQWKASRLKNEKYKKGRENLKRKMEDRKKGSIFIVRWEFPKIPLDSPEFPRIPLSISKFPQIHLNFPKLPWIPPNAPEFLWRSPKSPGFLWIPLNISKFP